MGLKERLYRLEGGDECAACGWDSGMRLEIVWDHDEGGGAAAEGEPDYCPACGRPDEIVVTWGDADESW